MLSLLNACDGSSDRSLMVNPLSYVSFQPELHEWYNTDRGMCFPVNDFIKITSAF